MHVHLYTCIYTCIVYKCICSAMVRSSPSTPPALTTHPPPSRATGIRRSATWFGVWGVGCRLLSAGFALCQSHGGFSREHKIVIRSENNLRPCRIAHGSNLKNAEIRSCCPPVLVLLVPLDANNTCNYQEGICKATWKRDSKLSWREAGPPNHLDDQVDLDQWVTLSATIKPTQDWVRTRKTG